MVTLINQTGYYIINQVTNSTLKSSNLKKEKKECLHPLWM